KRRPASRARRDPADRGRRGRGLPDRHRPHPQPIRRPLGRRVPGPGRDPLRGAAPGSPGPRVGWAAKAGGPCSPAGGPRGPVALPTDPVLVTIAVWRPYDAPGPVPVIVDAGPYFENGPYCKVRGQGPCPPGARANLTVDVPTQTTPFSLKNFLPLGYAVAQVAI